MPTSADPPRQADQHAASALADAVGALVARGTPRLEHFLIFFVGTPLMRSAGCAINDHAAISIRT